MRWTGWTLLGVGLSAVVTAIVTVSCAGRTNVESGAERTLAEKIARGKQISWAAGCNDCHTPGTFYGVPDTTRLLSGSELGWEGPWGVTYPRNLTPDPETGIASWTEHDIVTAFRTGQRPDKSPLLPPMPWPAYAHMSDDDAYALAAYIKSLPPVRHQAPARLAPGKGAGPRLVFPPPPAWDGRHLPPPEAAATTKSEDM